MVERMLSVKIRKGTPILHGTHSGYFYWPNHKRPSNSLSDAPMGTFAPEPIATDAIFYCAEEIFRNAFHDAYIPCTRNGFGLAPNLGYGPVYAAKSGLEVQEDTNEET